MKRTIRRGALVIALLVVAISAFRLWEIGRSYRKANQVYRQTADRFVQQAPADTQPVQPHGERSGRRPFLWILMGSREKIRMWWAGFTAPVPS